jgi:hypothetical protein
VTYKSLFSFRSSCIEDFEKLCLQSKQLGATHILLTEDLPRSLWQYEETGDPYCAWFIAQPALMKVFPPEAVKPFMNAEYSKQVVNILKQRCSILKKLGLKGFWWTNEPHVLPETFYSDYPHLRGPRVDQSNRARLAHFAPCVDQPEVLEMYKESIQRLLSECPEVEIFYFLTTDSGSGFCWSPALYPGRNGNTLCRNRPMEERVAGFLLNLKDAANDIGKDIEVDIVEVAARKWMKPTFEDVSSIVSKLPASLAVNHLEGPDGKRFLSRDQDNLWFNVFYPVLGIPRPFDFIRKCMEENSLDSSHKIYTFNDASMTELNFKLLEIFKNKIPATRFDMQQFLHDFAGQEYGTENADNVYELWFDVDRLETLLNNLDFGPVILMSCVLNRSVIRPLIPFPEELDAEQKVYYMPYILQAKEQQQADNLIDIQAMRMFEGWGARLLVQNILLKALAAIDDIRCKTQKLSQAGSSSFSSQNWELLGTRFEVLRCFVVNIYNIVSYQAQLDRVKPRIIEQPVDPNPVLGTQGSWEYEDMINTARSEIDNSIKLKMLIENCGDQLVDLSDSPELENILQLGPGLCDNLSAKIEIMNGSWQDYKRIFVTPNP